MYAGGRPAPRRERWNHYDIAERHAQPGRSHLLSEVGIWVVIVLPQSSPCRSLHILNGTFAICKHVSLHQASSFQRCLTGCSQQRSLLTISSLRHCHLAPLRSLTCALRSVTFCSRIGYVRFNLLLSVVVTFVYWALLVLRRLIEKLYVNTLVTQTKLL